MRIILVCGDRNWQNGDLIYKTLFMEQVAADGNFDNKVKIIHGAARGADTFAGIAAEEIGCDIQEFPADWKKYGKAAGPIRNQQMLEEGKPDLVLAFHDDIEHSKGTKDMVTRAKKANIPVRIITSHV